MLPKWHILLGIFFSITLFAIFPSIGFLGLLVIFLSGILIDVDHYLTFVFKIKQVSLAKAYHFYIKLYKQEKKEKQKGIRKKGLFHILHTVEIHIILLVLSFFSRFFLFIFIGFLFHSFVDLVELIYLDRFYRREYFFTVWLIKKLRLS